MKKKILALAAIAAMALASGAYADEVEFPEGECFKDSLIVDQIDGEDTTWKWNDDYKIVEFKTTSNVDGNGNPYTMRTVCIDDRSRVRTTQAINMPEGIEIDSVAYNRHFLPGVYSTVVFPFEANSFGNVFGANVYKFVKIHRYSEWNPWAIDFASQGDLDNGTIAANTPYLIVGNGDGQNPDSTIKISNKIKGVAPFILKAPSDNLYSVIPEADSAEYYSSKWQFRGTYEYKKWTAESSDLGRVYGLTSKDTLSVDGKSLSAGTFVKGAAGVSIAPMRAYLYYNRVSVLSKSTSDSEEDLTDEELPEVITLRLLNSNGEVTAIGELNIYTGNVTMDKDVWFDMKGRKFNKKPTVKGTYYNQGKKVTIK